MNIVILGAGKTGSYVASVLSQEEHDVTVIDRDAKILEQLGRESDVATLHAFEPSWKLFEELIENRPHLFFAATGDDATNLVSCSIAKNLGFPKTIARVKARDYLSTSRFDFNRLFLVDHFIGAEVLAAQDLFQTLMHAGDIAVEHFAHGAIQMRTLIVPDLWDRGGTSIRELSLPETLIVGLIRRKTAEGETLLVPHGEDHILPGDEIIVIGEAKTMNRLHEIFHSPERRAKSVVLVGGTLVAEHLAHFLLQQHIAVRIIDSIPSTCEHLAEILPQATIIHRDGRNPALLRAERVESADAVVSCTHDDGKNLLIAALAKELGCPKAIAVVTDTSTIPILEKVGVLPALSAKVNLANRILSLLHEETLLSISSLCNDQAKIVELKIAPSSSLIGIPLADLSPQLPKDLLIAVIQNRGRVVIGRGNQTLSPDDTVIVICPPHRIPELPGLFH